MASDTDKGQQFNFVTSPFDTTRHIDGDREFWRARELSKILGYNRWENFENVIAKAKIACKYNERDVDDHFREVTKMTKAGKGAKRSIRDLELSRYACYILVQNADASKPIVAHAMDYFKESLEQKIGQIPLEEEYVLHRKAE
jgi:DNA-damage-inducible protein D